MPTPAITKPTNPTTPTPPTAPPQSPARWRFRLVTKSALKRIAVAALVLIACAGAALWYCTAMPGTSFRGTLPASTPAQQLLAARLETHVRYLAGEVGARSTYYPRKGGLAARYIREQLLAAGYTAVNETFVERGARVPNLEVVLAGADPTLPCVVIGAHYDSYQGSPGADDNASGTAAVIELAHQLKAMAALHPTGAFAERTIRLVLFVNEEPPAFQTADMGSWVYAKDLKARGVAVSAMVSLESIGYYRTEPGSQKYPVPGLNLLYPNEGDFVAIVGNLQSRALVRECVGAFRAAAKFPCEGASLPNSVPGVGWSDHWAFWQEGHSAVMVTGTAPFRNPHYHTSTDLPDTLDYDRLARVTEAMAAVAGQLAGKLATK